MIANKQFFMVSVLYRDKNNAANIGNFVLPQIAATSAEAEEAARHKAEDVIARTGWTHFEWFGTTASAVSNEVLEKIAIEVLGVDIQADHDEGSAG